MIYLDNSATTKVSSEVFEEVKRFLEESYGNPSSVYKLGRDAKSEIEKSREVVANALNAKNPREIIFTGSGTESDNLAIKGVFEAKGCGHIISTKIEHHAVLHTLEYLEKKGAKVTYLDVDKNGLINLDDLKNAIQEDTILISIMFANNEIGTIQPIEEIGKIAKEHNIYFHTDAVQAFGHEVIDVEKMNIDLLSLSAHKLHGLKGTGALYIRSGIKIKPQLHGGAQEKKRRPSTENVMGIVALSKATELAIANMEKDNKHKLQLRNKLIDGILETIPHTHLNGCRENRLSNNVNISFDFIEGESLILLLDMKQICVSSGSACTSGSLDPSHVLLALGLKHEEAHGSLRLSLSKYTTEDEINTVIKELKPIVERLRTMSPLYEDFLKKGKGEQ